MRVAVKYTSSQTTLANNRVAVKYGTAKSTTVTVTNTSNRVALAYTASVKSADASTAGTSINATV